MYIYLKILNTHKVNSPSISKLFDQEHMKSGIYQPTKGGLEHKGSVLTFLNYLIRKKRIIWTSQKIKSLKCLRAKGELTI